MTDIKTRDTVKGTIRTLDKAKIASTRMKSAYIQTKDKVEHSTHSEEHSANEYAIVTVDEVMQMLRIGKNSVYNLLQSKQISSLKVGARYIIPKQSVVEFITITNRKS